MGYTKEELERKNVHTLRQIGREKGVKAPSSLKKGDLIEQILGIEKGEIAPCFSTGGRPVLDTEFTIKNKTTKNNISQRKPLGYIFIYYITFNLSFGQGWFCSTTFHR
ncbi:MAG: Rho termination factor N-terminal domain-containing protein [Clostridia bacterium]|nr:Rho termination factor N-terminal domain-containing protein [Clostridia bacterium]